MSSNARTAALTQLIDCRYNIESGCCDTLKGCCFPCALFQHYTFLSDLQARGHAAALSSNLLSADGSGGVVVAQPVSGSTAKRSNSPTSLVITIPDGVVAGQNIQVRKPDGGSVSGLSFVHKSECAIDCADTAVLDGMWLCACV